MVEFLLQPGKRFLGVRQIAVAADFLQIHGRLNRWDGTHVLHGPFQCVGGAFDGLCIVASEAGFGFG